MLGKDARSAQTSAKEPESDEPSVKMPQLRSFFLSTEMKLFVFVAVIFVMTILPFTTTNEASHYALARAILFSHTFSINPYTRFAQNDVSYFRGNYYTPFAPGLSFLVIIPLALGTILGGPLNTALPMFGMQGFVTSGQLIALQLFSTLCAALSAVFVFKLCLVFSSKKYPALGASLVYAFATPVWVFSKTEFAHTFSALFLVSAFYYALKDPETSNRNAVISGMLCGAAVCIEYTNIVIFAPLVIYLLVRWARSKNLKMFIEKTTAFLSPIVLFSFLLLIYNYVLFQNLFTFPESYWVGYNGSIPTFAQEFSTPIVVGLNGLLISTSRGLAVYSPIVVFSIPGFLLLGKLHHKAEAILLASAFLANLFTYSMWSTWFGGESYGPRFLVPSLPFLIIPMFAFIQYALSSRSTLVKFGTAALTASLFIFSATIESIGALTRPAVNYYPNVSFYTFFFKDTYFPNIAAGRLQDLGFVILIDFTHIPAVNLGNPYWFFFIAMPSLVFLYVLAKVWLLGRNVASMKRY